MLEFRQLKQVLALAEHRNFRSAARSLYISQPALSISIKNLEDHLGVKLFERTTKNIIPTPVGEILIANARSILKEVEFTEREMNLLSEMKKGELRIGCDPLLNELLMPEILPVLIGKYPSLQYEVLTDGFDRLKELLVAKDIDLLFYIFVSSPKYLDPSVESIRFNIPETVYFCRKDHPLTRKKKIDFKDILFYPWVGNHVASWYVDWLSEATGLSKKEISYKKFTLKTNDVNTLKEVVKSTDAISGTLSELIKEEVARGDLVELDIKWKTAHFDNNASIYYLKDRILPPICLEAIGLVNKIAGKWGT